jgi:acetyl esterase/lipase
VTSGFPLVSTHFGYLTTQFGYWPGRELNPRHADFQPAAGCSRGLLINHLQRLADPFPGIPRHNPGTLNLSWSRSWHETKRQKELVFRSIAIAVDHSPRIRSHQDIRTHITPQTSPTFLLQNEDDHVDSVEDSLSYYFALKEAGVPVEMHLYAQGGHGFGLRRSKFPVTEWPQLVETWLRTLAMISH